MNGDTVKQHLIQLIQYQFIVSKYEEKRFLFSTDVNHFYNFQLIPVVLQEIKKKMGSDTVLIVELILQNGFLEVESKQNLAFLQDKIKKSKQYIRKKIEELIEQNYITQFTYPFELEIEAQQTQNAEKKRIFHKVNLQQFVKKFKRDLVINIAQKQLSQQTIDVFQQILLCDRDISMKNLEDNNKILSTEAIVLSIDTLCNENYIKRKENSKFQANNEYLQNLLVNQIVLKQISFKFSPIHSRVLMVLRTKGKLDDKAISELALIPLKDCRIILNELFEQGYISTHEVPIKPRENVGSFTYFYSED